MAKEERVRGALRVQFGLEGEDGEFTEPRERRKPVESTAGTSAPPRPSEPASLLSSASLPVLVMRRGLATLEHSSTTVRGLLDKALRARPDDSCLVCRRERVCREHGSYSLLKYHETPEFMKGNVYVTSGYRPEGFDALMAFRSMFHLNNETINIWSHILGFCLFSYWLFKDNCETLPSKNAGWMDHIIISLGLICFMICMAMSACFHIFWCISESSHNTWLCLDLLGVTFGILGCYVTGIHYAFYCYQLWHNTYMSIFLFLALITIIAPFHPEYAHAKFYWARLSLYLLVGVYGVIPTVHWVAQHGGLGSEFTQRFLPSILIVYALCALGVAFYILMIPERWLPGWFDLVGWSHQWWHLLILAALVWWRTAGLEILDYRRTTSCDGLEASFSTA